MKKDFSKQTIKNILSILAVLTILFLIWDLFLQKMFGNPFKPQQEYKGLSYYDSQEYKNYEKGELFVETFFSYEFSDQCEIIDFYYINNQDQDSLYYGICPDVYGLTLDAGDYYDDIRAYIQQSGTDRGSHYTTDLHGCHAIMYSMPVNTEDPKDLFAFIVGQDIPFLRFILITEYIDEDWDTPRDVVAVHSRLDFDLNLD